VIFNAPSADFPGTYEQHVYNTSNQSWQRFLGMSALCWSEFNRLLYFGKADGSVWQADIGTDDNGAAIVCNVQQAWGPLDAPANKTATGVRPIVQTLAGQGYQFSVGYDYNPLVVAISDLVAVGGASFWDVSTWDVSLWSVEASVNQSVFAAAGTGTSISFALKVNAMSLVTWMRTDLVIESAQQI
jgi:hypothetical protein